jgi:F-type H+-transporting ATPase subunit beta
VALVFGQMNEPPGARARVALSGLTMAEYFRDQGPGRAVLRRQHLPLHPGGFGSVGAARPYSFGGGLSADAGHRHGRAAGAHHLDQQGLDHLGAGDLRAGRRLDRPGAGHLVRPLGRDDRAVRAIAEKGIYPAVDPLDSTSRMLDPRSSARSTTTPPARAGDLQKYKSLQDIIAILGMDELSEEDKLTWPAPARSSASCRSRSTSPKCSPASPGKFVQIEGHHQGLQGVVDGEYDHLPEAAFYMVGTIDEAIEKAKKLRRKRPDLLIRYSPPRRGRGHRIRAWHCISNS